ncbi:MAG: hypothetical protein M3Q42_11820 [Pseudomonadota bacterium]|nr:hypothetical protein [Pseudomonadota bacterium]
MGQANFLHEADTVSLVVPTGGLLAGEIIQLPDGRAGYVDGLKTLLAGETASVRVRGRVTVAKTASVVLLDGGDVIWDHSANSATFPVATNDKDFHLGAVRGDAASAATTMVVDLNEKARGIIDLQSAPFATAVVAAAGAPYSRMQGGAHGAGLTTTAEAQKLDLLSKRSFPVNSNWIVEAVVEVVTNATADVGDLNVGVANATHASDADVITESVFAHFDMGADLNLDAESDDGTTEVAATDTTVDWVLGTPVHVVIDGRDHEDIQIIINGVLVLAATTFTLAAATGPLKALFHFEKSVHASPGEVRLDKLQVRLAPEVWVDVDA